MNISNVIRFRAIFKAFKFYLTFFNINHFSAY